MPRADAALLLLTLVLTVAVDLTAAIVAGVGLSLLLRRFGAPDLRAAGKGRKLPPHPETMPCA